MKLWGEEERKRDRIGDRGAGARTRLWGGSRGGVQHGMSWNRWGGTVTTAVWDQSKDVGVWLEPT